MALCVCIRRGYTSMRCLYLCVWVSACIFSVLHGCFTCVSVYCVCCAFAEISNESITCFVYKVNERELQKTINMKRKKHRFIVRQYCTVRKWRNISWNLLIKWMKWKVTFSITDSSWKAKIPFSLLFIFSLIFLPPMANFLIKFENCQ